MAVVTKRNQSEMPKHQYRLNDNHKGADFASINGVNLSRDYKTFFNFKHDLKEFIKTYNNPDGTIDYRVLNPIENDNMLDQSEMNYGQKREIFTRKTLSTFDRKEIERLSLSWLINPIKKRTEFLIDLIVKEQALYEEYHEKFKDSIKEVKDSVDDEEELLNIDLDIDVDDNEEDVSMTDTVLNRMKEEK